MNAFLAVGKLLLFMISNVGYWEHFRRRTKMNLFYLPAFTVSLQITALFCAGILNCLQIVSVLLFLSGIALAGYYIVKDIKGIGRTYSNTGYAFFALAFFLALAACIGSVFTHYDNFSHWALVVKSMLLTNRFPNFQDTLIVFQEYPVGSASYIYYFSKMVWASEGFQMAAQAFLMLSFLLPVFQFVKRNKVFSFLYTLLFVNFIFCYNIGIQELLVDTLLPLQGMAMLLFLYTECLGFEARDKKGRVPIWYAAPFLCTCMQIKNSGIYFAAIGCILIGISAWRSRPMRKEKILVMTAPFISLFLWHSHCGYVFPASSTSKHAMTVGNYKNIYLSKTEEEMEQIWADLLKFSISGKELCVFLAFLLVIGLLAFWAGREIRKRYVRFLAASAVMYVSYMTGVFFMYLFSMPGGEATNLSGFGRYQKTIFIAMYYMILIVSLETISFVEDRKMRTVYSAAACIMLLVGWRVENGKFANIFMGRGECAERQWFRELMEDYGVEKGASYIICDGGGYLYYMSRYLFYSDQVSVRTVTQEAQLEDVSNYQYILVYEEDNQVVQEWIEKNYPGQSGNPVIKIAGE